MCPEKHYFPSSHHFVVLQNHFSREVLADKIGISHNTVEFEGEHFYIKTCYSVSY